MQTEHTFRRVTACASRVQESKEASTPPMGESSMSSWMEPGRPDSFQRVSMRTPTSSRSVQRSRKASHRGWVRGETERRDMTAPPTTTDAILFYLVAAQSLSRLFLAPLGLLLLLLQKT